MMTKMTSNKPYLIRSLYEWIVDNDCTPYILVDANYPGIEIPMDYVSDGKIILNISPNACRGLVIENHKITFTARFSGITYEVICHPGAVLAIYAKENGRGMEFELEYYDETDPPPSSSSTSSSTKKGHLTLVK